jgi:hypothetical protein
VDLLPPAPRAPQTHKHVKSTNLLERLNQELKRRTHVVRIFPNDASCLRLIRALASEQHEEWFHGPVYLDMQPLRELLSANCSNLLSRSPPEVPPLKQQPLSLFLPSMSRSFC